MFPLTKRVISGYRFGQKTWYSDYKKGHLGVDYRGTKADAVYAPFAGKVTGLQYNKFDVGNAITLVCGDKRFRFMHLDRIVCGLGNVAEGDILGYVGNTGWSDGSHLHLDVSNANVGGAFWLNIANFQDPETFAWVPVAIDQPINPTPAPIQGEQASYTVPVTRAFEPFNVDLSPSQVHSDEVARVQKFLVHKGFLSPLPDNEYGYYGKKTQAAVDAFQKANGIPKATKYGWWYPATRGKANQQLS